LCRKTGLAFLRFFYDFGVFCNILFFIKKKEAQNWFDIFMIFL